MEITSNKNQISNKFQFFKFKLPKIIASAVKPNGITTKSPGSVQKSSENGICVLVIDSWDL